MRVKTKHPTLKSHLKNIIYNLDIDLVVDVGANKGQFGKLIRDIGYRKSICSFEPVPSTFEKLNETSGYDNEWYIYNLAMGSSIGELDINVYPDNALSSFRSPTDYAKNRYSNDIEIIEKAKVRLIH